LFQQICVAVGVQLKRCID